MTPAQKLALEAKLASQRVNQLLGWLDQNRATVADGENGLREQLRSLLGRFDGLQQAIDGPPTIGVIGEAGSGKSQLVKALTAPAAGSEADRGRISETEILRTILLTESDLRSTAALRFRAAAPAAPGREHPFRIGLLGLGDLAAIMARIYCTGCPKARVAIPRLERIAAIYDEVSRNIQAGTVPGFTERDVFQLRDMLDAQFPEAQSLKILSAAGYWNDLAEVAAHIGDAERLKVLSLLWGEEEQITRLFNHLGESLARLGFVTEAFCPREALIELDGASGWLRRHGESIIDIATLARLGEDKAATLHVVGRYGQGATVTRAAMAALISELTLTVTSGALVALKPTEIIEFPSFMPAGELALGLGSLDAGGVPQQPDQHAASCSREQLVKLYGHAKAAHLFDRASQRNDVTSLAVCVDPSVPANDTLQPAIGDWIDFAQGFDPETREQRRTGLLVVATETAVTGGDREAARGASLVTFAGMSADLVETVAGDESWPLEWTPGRPFLNVVTLRGQGRGAATGLARGRAQSGADPLVAASQDANAHAVLRAIAQSSNPSTKQRQLRRQLGELHRRLRSRFLRLNGESEMTEWRQRVASLIEHRLYRVVRRGRLGLLLGALMIGESELAAVHQRYRRQSFAGSANRTLGAASGDLDALALASFAADDDGPGGRAAGVAASELAHRAVSHWHVGMRRAARSGRMCRAIGLSEAVLDHMIDEIGIGAARLGLVDRVRKAIEAAYAAASDAAPNGNDGGSPSGERAFVAAVAPVINGFVETLVAGSDRAARNGKEAAGIAVLPAANGSAGEIVWDDPAINADLLADRWVAALARLMEANISSSRYHQNSGHASELGRLLAQLPVSHLEVEV